MKRLIFYYKSVFLKAAQVAFFFIYTMLENLRKIFTSSLDKHMYTFAKCKRKTGYEMASSHNWIFVVFELTTGILNFFPTKNVDF